MDKRFLSIYAYYKRLDVQYNLIPQLFNREFGLLIPSWVTDQDTLKTSTRMLRAHSCQHIQYILSNLRWAERELPYNFYHSLATYKTGVPFQNMRFWEHSREPEIASWKEIHESEMGNYDLLLDIDAPDHDSVMLAHEGMVLIHDYFMSLQVPHIVKFSGKGFHIVIPGHYNNYNREFSSGKKNNIYMFYARIAKKLQAKFTDFVDTSIYDPRRLCKLAYSLSIYQDLIYVSYPLNQNDIETFRLEDYEFGNFNRTIIKRGLILFNPYGDLSRLLVDLNFVGGDKFGDGKENTTG